MPSTSLPVSAAIAGWHVKFELPRPNISACVDADNSLQAWLLRLHEYVTILCIDPSAWVVVASNLLDTDPLALWEARKTQLCEQSEALYPRNTFRRWCISSFGVLDHEKRALNKLQPLHQTGTVAAYKAAHNLLAPQAKPPMQLCLLWWANDFKPEGAGQGGSTYLHRVH